VAEDDEHQIGYQALPRGTEVVTSDGVTLGTVYRVLDNAREHIFDGIIIRTPEGRRFVDAPEVARITARRVTLNITAAQAADHITDHRGTLGALEINARRTAKRWRRRFGG
jgi:hypothetical protein